MTTGLILGTSEGKPRIFQVARSAGFNVCQPLTLLKHRRVKELVLQIHPILYFEGVEGIVTEMEFDDYTDRFPNNSKALEVLRQMYSQLLDLRYKEYVVMLNVNGSGMRKKLLKKRILLQKKKQNLIKRGGLNG